MVLRWTRWSRHHGLLAESSAIIVQDKQGKILFIEGALNQIQKSRKLLNWLKPAFNQIIASFSRPDQRILLYYNSIAF